MNVDELKTQLGQFTGTAGYTRLMAKVILTDGAVFLADNAKAWWLLDLYASYLLHIE